MRLILALVLVCGYNMFNKEEPIVFRLMLPFAIMIGVIRQWFVISLPNATVVPLRAWLYNLANWFRALALWSIVGGIYVWDHFVVPEQ